MSCVLGYSGRSFLGQIRAVAPIVVYLVLFTLITAGGTAAAHALTSISA